MIRCQLSRWPTEAASQPTDDDQRGSGPKVARRRNILGALVEFTQKLDRMIETYITKDTTLAVVVVVMVKLFCRRECA